MGEAPVPLDKKVTVFYDSVERMESFDPITITQPGTYTWTVSETHKGETIDGIQYADEDQTVTVTVEPDVNGNLVPKQGSTLTPTVKFTNKYIPEAEITKAPEGKELTYSGSSQELVTAGEAKDGTILYAIGEDATTVPTENWGTTIPAATATGTYFVWYMAKGDNGYRDTEPVCIQVEIKAPKVTPTPTPKVTPTPTPKVTPTPKATPTPTPKATPTPTPKVQKVKMAAVYNSSRGADIRWKKVAGATGYVVYCQRKAEGLRKVATIKDPNVTRCYDKKIKSGCWGRVYHYYVRALYGKKEGPKSEKLALVRIAPMKITGLTNTSEGTVTCTYKCSVNKNRAGGYEVQYAESRDDLKKRTGTYQAVKVRGRKNLSKTISGLEKGKTYYFHVRAFVDYTNSYTNKKTRSWSVYSSYSNIARIKAAS